MVVKWFCSIAALLCVLSAPVCSMGQTASQPGTRTSSVIVLYVAQMAMTTGAAATQGPYTKQGNLPMDRWRHFVARGWQSGTCLILWRGQCTCSSRMVCTS